MSISVFHGAPTSNDGQSVPSGVVSLGIDVTSGLIYFKSPSTTGWQATGATGSSGLPLTGGTLSGSLTISSASPALNLFASSGNPSINIGNATVGAARFSIYLTNGATDNLAFYADGFGNDVMHILGSTGQITFLNGPAPYFQNSFVTGGTPATPAAGNNISFGGVTQTTVGAAGGASALPATPTGYLQIKKNGSATLFVIPFYAAS